MSKPRLKVSFDVDTFSHSNIVKASLQAILLGKDIFETHVFSSFSESLLSRNYVVGEWRFNNFADRDLVWDFALGVTTSGVVKNWVNTGSVVTRHLCTHDDLSTKNCETTSYERFVK